MLSDMLVSRSTSVVKGVNDSKTKNRLFGGLPVKIPEGTPLIELLDLLDEEQLYKLNDKIVKTYHKFLTEKHLGHENKTIIDNDPRIRKRRPTVTDNNKLPFEGPPLQKKAGHFKFKDKYETPLKKQ